MLLNLHSLLSESWRHIYKVAQWRNEVIKEDESKFHITLQNDFMWLMTNVLSFTTIHNTGFRSLFHNKISESVLFHSLKIKQANFTHVSHQIKAQYTITFGGKMPRT